MVIKTWLKIKAVHCHKWHTTIAVELSDQIDCSKFDGSIIFPFGSRWHYRSNCPEKLLFCHFLDQIVASRFVVVTNKDTVLAEENEFEWNLLWVKTNSRDSYLVLRVLGAAVSTYPTLSEWSSLWESVFRVFSN